MDLLDATDFDSLKQLKYLRNIFLRFEWIQNNKHKPQAIFQNLFESLTACQNTYQNMLLMSISLAMATLPEFEYKQMENFIEACTNTMEKVVLNFSYLLPLESQLDRIYGSIAKLKKLRSISVAIDEGSGKSKDLRWYVPAHYPLLTKSIHNTSSLEELTLIIPYAQLSEAEIPADKYSNLKKLKLSLISKMQEEMDISFLKDFMTGKLEHLELDFSSLSIESFEKIINIIQQEKRLETVKLRYSSTKLAEPSIKETLETLLENHESLKLIVFRFREACVLRKGKYWTNIDEFCQIPSSKHLQSPVVYTLQEKQK